MRGKLLMAVMLLGLLLLSSEPVLAQEEGEEGAEDAELTVWDWLGHAILGFAVLFLVVCILITGASLSGRIKGWDGKNLFKIHKRISILLSVVVMSTFFYGLWVTSLHGKPLLSSIHGWLGLAIAVLAVIQLVPSLVIKERTKLKTPHMLLGYTLALLVLLEVVWGLHTAVLGKVKSIVLIHSISGGIAALALAWIIVELRHLTENGIARAKNASYIAAFFNIAGCWVAGGYNYLKDYGANVRSAIIAGSQPWAHQIVMETKEHIFIFLPVLSILLAIALFTLGQDDTLLKDTRARRSVMLLSGFALLFVLLMFVMGALISYAGALGGE